MLIFKNMTYDVKLVAGGLIYNIYTSYLTPTRYHC